MHFLLKLKHTTDWSAGNEVMIKPGQCIWIFSTVQAKFLTCNPLRNDEAQAKEEKIIYTKTQLVSQCELLNLPLHESTSKREN